MVQGPVFGFVSHHPLSERSDARKQAIDFADEHPNTDVIGTDLSPIQPSLVFVLKICHYGSC